MPTISGVRGKGGRSVYRVRIRIKGCPTQSASFPSLQEARQWARVTEASILEKRFQPSIRDSHILAEAIERYLVEILPHKRPNTIIGQTQRLKWWATRLGEYRLSEITPAMLVDCRNMLAQQCKSSTVNNYLAVLGHMFSVSVKEWNWINHNPMVNICKLTKPRGRVRFLSDDERQRLLMACKVSRNPYLYAVVILALSTGCRKMELLSLRWSDIDLQRELIHIRNSKNGEPRTLPLTGQAFELMQQHYKFYGGNGSYIFQAPHGNRPYNIRSTWEEALKISGIKDFAFHCLRHSAVSYLAMNGESLIEIAHILGYKDLSTTMKYAHLAQNHTRKVLEAMTSKL